MKTLVIIPTYDKKENVELSSPQDEFRVKRKKGSETAELINVKVSIGIPAYNEGKDIGKVITAIQNQVVKPVVKIKEIIVVDGKSNDRTRIIIRRMMKRDPRIKLLVQKKRRGKIEAINIFIAKAKEELLIMANADNIPARNCLQEVINPLSDKNVGLSGPQMICLNKGDGFFAYVNHLIWRLHHKISLKDPKMSSFVAFRKSEIGRIPSGAIIDEPALEAMMQSRGKVIIYCPEARVYLKGAENFSDYCQQRRRNHFGYLSLSRIFPHYRPSTLKLGPLIRVLLPEVSIDIVNNFYLLLAIIFEAYCRLLGVYDFYLKKKNYQPWPEIKTSKGLKLNENKKTA